MAVEIEGILTAAGTTLGLLAILWRAVILPNLDARYSSRKDCDVRHTAVSEVHAAVAELRAVVAELRTGQEWMRATLERVLERVDRLVGQ